MKKFFTGRTSPCTSSCTSSPDVSVVEEDRLVHTVLGSLQACEDGADVTEVSVAGLVCNTPTWRIKGGYAASEAVREFFQNERKSNEVAAK